MSEHELESLLAYCEAWLLKPEATREPVTLSSFLSEHPLSSFAT